MVEQIRPPLMSGFCGHPAKNGDSHARCAGGQRANPGKVYQPCPCPCHLGEERYECEGCSGDLAEAPLLVPMLAEEPDEMVYVHIDHKTGRMAASGEFCP